MKKLIFVLAILVLYVGGCLTGSSTYRTNYNFSGIDRIAIVAVDGMIKNENAKNQISNLFVMNLLDKGYVPTPLAQAKAKIQSMAQSEEPLEIPQGSYAEIGKILKVPAVLVINVPYFDDEIFLSAQLIDTNDGSVLWMDQGSGETGILSTGADSRNGNGVNQEEYLMDPLLMLHQPQEQTKQSVLPPKPGERPLTPRESKKVENVVNDICRSLPSAKINTIEAPIVRTKPGTTSNW